MARNQRLIHASPDDVFAVLADAETYHRWVVGAKEVRSSDASWPQAGSYLHHSIGIGPLGLQDNTKVLEVDPPHVLVLEARGRPLGRARIVFRLAASGDAQTRVTVDEVVVSPRPLALIDPIFAPLVKIRNAETLRRLARFVAQHRSGH